MIRDILILISFFGCVFTTFMFAVGFHNMDLGQNLRWINAMEHSDYVDYSDNDIEMPARELFIKGCSQMIWAFFASMLFSMSFMMGLMMQNDAHDQKRK